LKLEQDSKKAAACAILFTGVRKIKFKRQTKHVATLMRLLRDGGASPPTSTKISDKEILVDAATSVAERQARQRVRRTTCSDNEIVGGCRNNVFRRHH